MFFVEENGNLSMYSTMPFINFIPSVSSFPQNIARGSIKLTTHKSISPVRIMLDNGIATKLVMINRLGNW